MLCSRSTTPTHMKMIPSPSHAPSASGPAIPPPCLGTSSPTPLASWTPTFLPMLADQRARSGSMHRPTRFSFTHPLLVSTSTLPRRLAAPLAHAPSSRRAYIAANLDRWPCASSVEAPLAKDIHKRAIAHTYEQRLRRCNVVNGDQRAGQQSLSLQIPNT